MGEDEFEGQRQALLALKMMKVGRKGNGMCQCKLRRTVTEMRATSRVGKGRQQ
jgi:hypothetical protein